MSELTDSDELVDVALTVNTERVRLRVPARTVLSDALRDELGLTGTHVACEHGVCGACTVLLDGAAVRSCLVFAFQAEGCAVTTVEGLAPVGELNPVQEAMRECHGLQCGFCTPGIVVSLTAYLADHPNPSDAQLAEALAGNLCRCTGYQGILQAARSAADRMAGG